MLPGVVSSGAEIISHMTGVSLLFCENCAIILQNTTGWAECSPVRSEENSCVRIFFMRANPHWNMLCRTGCLGCLLLIAMTAQHGGSCCRNNKHMAQGCEVCDEAALFSAVGRVPAFFRLFWAGSHVPGGHGNGQFRGVGRSACSGSYRHA